MSNDNTSAYLSGEEAEEFKRLHRAMHAYVESPGDGNAQQGLIAAAYVTLLEKHGDDAHRIVVDAILNNGLGDAAAQMVRGVNEWNARAARLEQMELI